MLNFQRPTSFQRLLRRVLNISLPILPLRVPDDPPSLLRLLNGPGVGSFPPVPWKGWGELGLAASSSSWKLAMALNCVPQPPGRNTHSSITRQSFLRQKSILYFFFVCLFVCFSTQATSWAMIHVICLLTQKKKHTMVWSLQFKNPPKAPFNNSLHFKTLILVLGIGHKF